jgi:hypothetical protein
MCEWSTEKDSQSDTVRLEWRVMELGGCILLAIKNYKLFVVEDITNHSIQFKSYYRENIRTGNTIIFLKKD